MCGIAGIVNFGASEEKEALLRHMLGVMKHRGPDASGIFLDDPCGLGHVRLSIIDLSGGDQPIHNEDATVWVVFNGEIFNHPELRRELEAKGHRFRTRSDTEVLVHLYEEHGASLFNMLNGQFALAIWDSKRDRLLLGRDRMGIRPLFYHLSGRRITFGSEVKALFADKHIERTIDPAALADVFTGWSTLGDMTLFKGISQLQPGCCALFSKDGLQISRYWSLPSGRKEYAKRPLEDWVEELQTLLEDAVRIRLRSDVPVGAYLSGGLDSTYISSLVQKKFDNSLRTFSVGFTDERFDESAYQRIASESIGTKHNKLMCNHSDIAEVFPSVVWHAETPLLRTSPSPMYLLSRLVRSKGIKVVLTGEGADEIFAGYNIFKEDKIRRFWARQPESNIRFLLLKRIYPYIFAKNNTRAFTFLKHFYKQNIGAVHRSDYSHLPRWQNGSSLSTFLSCPPDKQANRLTHYLEKFNALLPPDFMEGDPLSRAQYIESLLFLPNYLLSSQGDRMAMGNSIECRFPFLDHRVVEFAFQLPPELRLNGLNEKFILKKASKGIVPNSLIERAKQPYRAPISDCFFTKQTQNYISDMLSGEAIRRAGCFDAKKVALLVKKCRVSSGNLLSERENMAIAGILSTQLIDNLFIKTIASKNTDVCSDTRIIRINALKTSCSEHEPTH